jgi:Flp pilus assembly pilin Flp
MSSSFKKHLRKLSSEEKAPSAIEYALLVAGVGVLILAVVYMLGGGARSAIEHAAPPEESPASSSNPSE